MSACYPTAVTPTDEFGSEPFRWMVQGLLRLFKMEQWELQKDLRTDDGSTVSPVLNGPGVRSAWRRGE